MRLNMTTVRNRVGRALRDAGRRQSMARAGQQLARLDDNLLRDIGITRDDVDRLIHRRHL